MLNRIAIFACFIIGLIFSSHSDSQAFAPSPQQIQQFKNLPRAQQEALARQLGFDVSLLDGLNNPRTKIQRDENEPDSVEREVDEDKISRELSKQSIVEEKSRKLKPFGHALFSSGNTSFAPVTNIPVPSDYVVGPGDSFSLRLYGKETGVFELLVNNEGSIDLPELGPTSVIGLTYQEVKQAIEEKYQEQKIGVQPFLSMGQLRTIQIFMVGEVFRPGSLTVSSLSTVSTALFNGGGVNELGSLRNIQLKRAGKTLAKFDLYDLMIKGDVSQDIRLEQGDVIFVPLAQNIISIDGQVRRPAIYELKDVEGLSTALEFAGGTLPSADESAIQVIRNNQGEGLSIQTINRTTAPFQATALKSGDFINVQKANLEFVDAIRVRGAINSPKLLSVKQRSTLSSVVTESAILKSTDMNYGLILRKPKLSEKSTVFQFKPHEVITGKFDLKLQAFDEVFLFSKFTNEQTTNSNVSEVATRDLRASGSSQASEDNELLANLGQESFTQKDLATEETTYNTRQSLLAAIVAQLRSESDEANKVQLAEINGQVHYPGIYPIASNAPSISALLNAAGGLTEAAHLEEAEISQFQIEKGMVNTQHKSINLIEQLTLPSAKQYKLQSKDVVKVARIPDWFESNTIELRGEFVFPGLYQIAKGETLSSVITRAGGLTENATLDAAVFMRNELKEREQTNIAQTVSDLRQQLAASNLSNSQFSRPVDYQTATEVLDDLIDIEPVGRLVIDFPAIVSGSKKEDVVLKDGDVLVVPNITPSISVLGEVFVTTTHKFDGDLSVSKYINLSGGYRNYADKGNIYIVRSDGSVFSPKRNFWFTGGNSSHGLKPGDTIVVPRKVTNHEKIGLWQGVTQIIYQTAIALAAIGGL